MKSAHKPSALGPSCLSRLGRRSEWYWYEGGFSTYDEWQLETPDGCEENAPISVKVTNSLGDNVIFYQSDDESPGTIIFDWGPAQWVLIETINARADTSSYKISAAAACEL